FPAITAEQPGRKPAPIQKQNRLLAFFQPGRNRLRQFLGKNRSDLFFPPFLAKIDNPYQRHPLIVDTLSESKQLIFAGGGVVITLERRRGAAEHHRTFLDLRSEEHTSELQSLAYLVCR